jgi:hypothetical protein
MTSSTAPNINNQVKQYVSLNETEKQDKTIQQSNNMYIFISITYLMAYVYRKQARVSLQDKTPTRNSFPAMKLLPLLIFIKSLIGRNIPDLNTEIDTYRHVQQQISCEYFTLTMI